MTSTYIERAANHATRAGEVVARVFDLLLHSYNVHETRGRLMSAKELALHSLETVKDWNKIERVIPFSETSRAELYASTRRTSHAAIDVALNVLRHAYPEHANKTRLHLPCEGCSGESNRVRAYLVRIDDMTFRVLYCDTCAEMCATAAVRGLKAWGAGALPNCVRISTYLDNAWATRDAAERMNARATFYGDE